MAQHETAMTKRQKIFRVIGACAGWVFIVPWFLMGLLENEYVTWPRELQPQIGRIIPYGVKGITVYITEYDQELHKWLTRVLIGSGTIAVVLLVASGELQRIMNPKR